MQKIVTMSPAMFQFLTETKAIRQTGLNYKLGDYIVIVEPQRTGFRLYPAGK